MPRTPFKNMLEEFIDSQSMQRGWKEETKRRYRRDLLKIREEFKGRKPSALSGKEILDYAENEWGDLAPKTKSWYWNIFKNFLEYCGNTDLQKIKFKIGDKTDREVYWLDEVQAEKVRETVEKMREEYLMIFHLGRDLGLRRCEMLWLKKGDFREKTGNIVVKGKYDKQRILPFHPMTEEYLKMWREDRKKKIERAEEKRKTARTDNQGPVTDPEHFLIWQDRTRVGSFGETSIDKRLKKIEEESGVEINGFHTLRRTFARHLFNQGIRKDDISNLLGHESTDVTERYIGIQKDRMREALSIAHQRSQTPSDGDGAVNTSREVRKTYFRDPRQMR